MKITPEIIKTVLLDINHPVDKTKFILEENIKKIDISESSISLELVFGYPTNSLEKQVQESIKSALKNLPPIETVSLRISSSILPHAVQRNLGLMPEIKNIIAIGSGKGGVGKSTTAVNLALALSEEGAQVGLLDADIYGPSQQRMMGLSDRPDSPDGKKILPMVKFGLQTMSIGLLVEEDTPMVWRGPMVTGALEQLLRDTLWKDLDYLIVDLPPGTGDIQLTLSQKVPMTGAIIVTTPQDISMIDAQKALKMFEKVGVPILGVLENMSVHVCEKCGHEENIFGEGAGFKMSTNYDVELLGKLPLKTSIRAQTDAGNPPVLAEPDGVVAKKYKDMAMRVAIKISNLALSKKNVFPKIVVQNS